MQVCIISSRHGSGATRGREEASKGYEKEYKDAGGKRPTKIYNTAITSCKDDGRDDNCPYAKNKTRRETQDKTTRREERKKAIKGYTETGKDGVETGR